MTRVKIYETSTTFEKILGGGPHARIINALLDAEKPLQQSEVARRAGTSEMTVSRIVEKLIEDPRFSRIFETEKYTTAKTYQINQQDEIVKKLKEIRSITRGDE